MSKLYPIGIQSFEKIREQGYIYVDKTALIYQLSIDISVGGYRSILFPQPSTPFRKEPTYIYS